MAWKHVYIALHIQAELGTCKRGRSREDVQQARIPCKEKCAQQQQGKLWQCSVSGPANTNLKKVRIHCQSPEPTGGDPRHETHDLRGTIEVKRGVFFSPSPSWGCCTVSFGCATSRHSRNALLGALHLALLHRWWTARPDAMASDSWLCGRRQEGFSPSAPSPAAPTASNHTWLCYTAGLDMIESPAASSWLASSTLECWVEFPPFPFPPPAEWLGLDRSEHCKAPKPNFWFGPCGLGPIPMPHPY